jgi:hypothetical protein
MPQEHPQTPETSPTIGLLDMEVDQCRDDTVFIPDILKRDDLVHDGFDSERNAFGRKHTREMAFIRDICHDDLTSD